tara:strand:+ start:1212 stop:1694 length:483 start_codon:yes stop_codon:yes gene_type:complete
MNKLAAEKIASHYYQLGAQLALRNAGLSKTANPSERLSPLKLENASDRPAPGDDKSQYHQDLQRHFMHQAMRESDLSVAPLDPNKFRGLGLENALADKYDGRDKLESMMDNVLRRKNQMHGYDTGPGLSDAISFNALTDHHTPVVDRSMEGQYAHLPKPN